MEASWIYTITGWKNPIFQYLKYETLPYNKNPVRTIQHRVTKFALFSVEENVGSNGEHNGSKYNAENQFDPKI